MIQTLSFRPLMGGSSLRRKVVGFTLTELAIVLGVVGILIAAIWTAMAGVENHNKTQRAVSQLMHIVDGYRTLYNARGIDAADGTDLTCSPGVSSGFFPADMLIDSCSSRNPVLAYGAATWVKVTADLPHQGVAVYVYGLSKQDCISFASAISGASDSYYQNINGTSRLLPPFSTATAFTVSDVNNLCGNATGNSVIFSFSMR